MRGGIVVKFNLQFPYNTDVDQVRKVIKRVGIHYAHRKVIVEVPAITNIQAEENGDQKITEEVKQKVAQAAAAATVETQKKPV